LSLQSQFRNPRFIPLYGAGCRTICDEPEVNIDYERQGEKIVITYIFPGYTVSNVKRKIAERWQPFEEVHISGTGSYSIDTEPLLPALGRFVRIPSHFTASKVYYRRWKPSLEKNCELAWAGYITWDPVVGRFVKKFYEADHFFPKKGVEHSGPYYMDGYKVLLIQVRPLQYNPGKRLLRAHCRIKVYIQLSQIKTARCPKDDRFFEKTLGYPVNQLEGFGNLVLNPDVEAFHDIEQNRKHRLEIPDENRKTELLIIYGMELKRPADKLKTWKEKRGIITQTVSIEKIGNRAESIKKYIRNERLIRSPGLRYVLLFGGVDAIAVSQEKRRHEEITDHYFYTHRDAGPSECLLPWVAGGRIPVEKSENGMSVVDQIIRYEKEPPLDAAYYKKMTVAGSFVAGEDEEEGYQDRRAPDDSLKTLEDISSHMLARGFQVNRVYFSTADKNIPYIYRDGNPVPGHVKCHILTDPGVATRLLIRHINEGQLIVCHRGHGWWDGWEEPSFKTKDLKPILSNRQCVLFSINCLTGSFQESSKDVLSQKMLVLTGGPPTLIAANFLTSTWHNDSMAIALFDALWPGMIRLFPAKHKRLPIRYRRIGDVLNYAKVYLLAQHGANQETKKQFERYHVIGDPTLEIWAKNPSSLSLHVSESRGILFITMSECPEGSLLTIWHGRRLLKRIRPLGRRINLSIRNLDRGPPYSICLSAPGYRFTEASVRL